MKWREVIITSLKFAQFQTSSLKNMEEIEGAEDDLSFPAEDIEQKVNEVAEEVLKDAMWDEHKVPMWINQINEKLMQGLISLGKPYKYVITVVMQQKTGAQISGAVSCYYENTTDGVVC